MKLYFTGILFLLLPQHLFAQLVVTEKMDDSTVTEIIVIPKESDFTNELKYVGSIKTGDPSLKRSAPFDEQFKKLLKETISEGGNVLQMTHFENVKQRGLYNLKGDVYYTDKFDSLKTLIQLKRKKKYDKQIAYVTLFRPVYNHSLNDLKKMYVRIDKDTFEMKANTKFTIKLDRESEYQIYINDQQEPVALNVSFGEHYYIRCFVDFPNSTYAPAVRPGAIGLSVPVSGYRPGIKILQNKVLGEIESSFVKQYY